MSVTTKSGSRKSKTTSSARRVTLSKPLFPRAAPQSERDEMTAAFVVQDLMKKNDLSDLITMRGTLKFTFPAHASLEVRKRIVARFVGEAQSKIDADEQREKQMASIRMALAEDQAKGLIGKFQQTALSHEEAAALLGITTDDIKRARGMGLLIGCIIGYEFHIAVSEIQRFKDGGWPEFFQRGTRGARAGKRGYERRLQALDVEIAKPHKSSPRRAA